MTPLGDRLLRQIALDGPMRVADYMAAALSDPRHGYYATRDPLGAAGDFTTAPEISQMFGEMLGLWVAQVHADQGVPRPFVLAELGPGRGTGLADMLRAAGRVPGFAEAARVCLVETSPALRAAQAETLARAGANAGAAWVERVEDLPPGPLFVVANEFFDALPIRQFVRAADGWSERMVAADGGELAFALAPAARDAELDRRHPGVPPGSVVETCAPAEAIVATLASRIARDGGAVLALDYGAWDGTGDTLQAVAGHAYADPLAAPGEADLTAHVTFRALAAAAAPLRAGLATQGAFLERLGITARAQALARGPRAAEITAQHRRLTHPDEMGTLFKVLGLAPPGAPPLPALEDP